MKRHTHIFSNRCKGSVLIVVLWVCLGLVSVALLFGHSMAMANRGSNNELAGREAEQAVDGAARYVETLLLNSGTSGALPEETAYQSAAVPVGKASFWFLGLPLATDLATKPAFRLVDEGSKVNLNTATLAVLEGLPRMTETLANSILNWRGTPATPQAAAGDAQIYAERKPGYRLKSAPFESVEELALLNGFDSTLLYGEDTNLNGVLDPNEDDGDKTPPADNSDGKLDAGLLQYVTVFSRLSAMQTDGTSPRVDVSKAGPALTDLLTTKFGADRARAILPPNPPNRTFTSPFEFYVVCGTATTGTNGITADEFGQIASALTTTGGLYPSPINVNTAGEAVLASIEGLAENAATVVASRLGRSQQDSNIAWLADALKPDVATARQIGRCITGESYQVSADIAAVGEHGRGYRRTRFIIDTTTGKPRIIYRRNLGGLGWALGSEVRQSLLAQKETETTR
ncbi:MAG: hypothetical protein QOD99_2527 [Chthoniobacter sp.]|jgi:type II secretory pathway component PulK|nr:hypothetical protein [Chthoniobacter sp.]